MPYAVQATTLWAIELAYNQGWQLPGTMPEPYAEFAHRWGIEEGRRQKAGGRRSNLIALRARQEAEG